MQKTLTRKPCRILVQRPRDSCPKTAESMLKSRNIHARRRRFSCPNSTKIISKHRENHAQELRNSYRNPTRMLSTPHGITRGLRFAPANSQRAAHSRGGFRRHQTSPARSVATSRHQPRINRTTASIGVSAISQHRFTADCQHKPPDNAPHR